MLYTYKKGSNVFFLLSASTNLPKSLPFKVWLAFGNLWYNKIVNLNRNLLCTKGGYYESKKKNSFLYVYILFILYTEP